MWGIPPILIIFFGPSLRKKYLSEQYDTFFSNMKFMASIFLVNTIGFITLYNLEVKAALQQEVHTILLILGGFSFTCIDFSKFLYEDQIIPYFKYYCKPIQRKYFDYLGDLAEKFGRVFKFIFLMSLVSSLIY